MIFFADKVYAANIFRTEMTIELTQRFCFHHNTHRVVKLLILCLLGGSSLWYIHGMYEAVEASHVYNNDNELFIA